MEILGTALGIGCNQDTRDASVFGIEGAGLHLKFAHRIETQLRILAIVRADVSVDAAIEKDVILTAAEPIDVERVGVVKGKPEVGRVVRCYARRCAEERLKVAAI